MAAAQRAGVKLGFVTDRVVNRGRRPDFGMGGAQSLPQSSMPLLGIGHPTYHKLSLAIPDNPYHRAPRCNAAPTHAFYLENTNVRVFAGRCGSGCIVTPVWRPLLFCWSPASAALAGVQPRDWTPR